MRRSLLLVIAVILVAAGCGTSDTAPPRPSGGNDTPDAIRSRDRQSDGPPANAAPDFTVETFTGERFSLGEQRGTPVVLNFWESW